MDILKKAVLLVAILSISVFMPGCGGDEAADDAGTEAQDSADSADTPGIEALGELKEQMEDK